MFTCSLSTPAGPLYLLGDGSCLHGARFEPFDALEDRDGSLAVWVDALGGWFSRPAAPAFGLGKAGGPPLAPLGTSFQRDVWAAVSEIPVGKTATYGDICRILGLTAGSARAVGAANGANPWMVVVPCHRVVGAGGALVGYAGGLERKRALLAHERRHTPFVLEAP